jgi:MT-A70
MKFFHETIKPAGASRGSCTTSGPRRRTAIRLNSSARVGSSSALRTVMCWSSAPAPIRAAPACRALLEQPSAGPGPGWGYAIVSLQEIQALPAAEVTSERSHCYLWWPNAILPEGLETLRRWGYTYKGNIVWHKVRKDGQSDGRGVGFYFSQ